MIAQLRSILPDRLAARFAVLLIAALLAANLVALSLLSFERKRFDRQWQNTGLVERTLALVSALEAVEPALRPDIARDASSRMMEVRIEPAPLVDASGADARSSEIAAGLAEAHAGRRVAVVSDARSVLSNRRKGRFNGHDVTAISIALQAPVGSGEQGAWLNIVAAGGRGRGGGPQEGVFLFVLGLSLLSALGVGLYFTRQLTKPLTALANAARAAGHGDHSIRVPEKGAKEMRDAAKAFNTMQSEIARFDAERMRTLAAVGHDLRTPITSLRIRAEMVEQADVRDAMVRTLDEMGVMADGLVAYAKGSRETEDKQLIDLSEHLTRLCADRGASLEIESPASIMGRPVAISRAIGNLIDNAQRYGGSARVTLRSAPNEAIITVDDNGPGIARERLETVFEPFVRGEESRNPETGGAGLGLSICRAIILAHGGVVELENRKPNGLRATVRLPSKMP